VVTGIENIKKEEGRNKNEETNEELRKKTKC